MDVGSHSRTTWKTLTSILFFSSISILYFLDYYWFRFSIWYQSPKALTSHLEPSTSTPFLITFNQSFLITKFQAFHKLITQISPWLKNQKNPTFPINFTHLTRHHSRQRALDYSFTRRRTPCSRSASYSHQFKWQPPSIHRSEADLLNAAKISAIGGHTCRHVPVEVLEVRTTSVTRLHLSRVPH